MFDICTDVHFDSQIVSEMTYTVSSGTLNSTIPWQSNVCVVAYSGHFCFGGDHTKPAI